jgi:uncharacterized protein YprB with RNaseH-like and TPR domain
MVENDIFYLKHWFAESPLDEPELLHDFFSTLNLYDQVIHFNGTGFDIPYLEEKCKKYSLPFHFKNHKSIDIYKKISSFKKILKLENLKQKTIENFLKLKEKIFSPAEN